MKRRLILSSIAIPAVAGAERKAPVVKGKPQINYYLPVDAFVTSIAQRGEVKSGQALLQLHSPQLDRNFLRIKTFQKMHSTLLHPLKDGHTDAMIEILKSRGGVGAAMVAEAIDAAKFAAVDTQRAAANSLRYASEVMQEGIFIQVRAAHLNIADANTLLTAFENYIEEELKILKQIQELLATNAPFASKFEPRVQVGQFVPQGSIAYSLG